MQIMAIDYGSKRVGVASTDETGEFALPRVVLENNEELIDRLLKFISEHNIEQVVIGESKNFDGSPNLIQKDIDLLSSMLMSKGIDIVSHPEVMTTVEARRLQGTTQMTDASAAALILKNFLDTGYNNIHGSSS